MEMTPAAELALQQICDSVFPIGAYSHSYGLETYIQLDLVRDEATARAFLEAQVRYPLAYTELLSMRLAYGMAEELRGAAEGGLAVGEAAADFDAALGEAAAAGDAAHATDAALGEAAATGDAVRAGEAALAGIARLVDLEARLAALKTPREMREASERLAARFIRTVPDLAALGPRELAAFRAYAAARGSHAVTVSYGAFAALAGIDLVHLLRRYLYAQVSALTVTCVKSVPLSQMAGQRLIAGLRELEACAVERALTADESLLGLSMPGFDVRSIEHETLYSRLYMS